MNLAYKARSLIPPAAKSLQLCSDCALIPRDGAAHRLLPLGFSLARTLSYFLLQYIVINNSSNFENLRRHVKMSCFLKVVLLHIVVNTDIHIES